MSCARARQLLGAYRRDDWPDDEIGRLGQHLATCVECRRAEAAYREVGEHVRQLPTIIPPASFREAVFAAIRREEEAALSPMARVARAATDPVLPVVRARIAPRPRRAHGSAPWLRAAAALAAVLVLAVLADGVARVSPRSLVGGVDSLFSGTQAGSVPVSVSYTPDHAPATAALANADWVVYTASVPGGTVLVAHNRQTQRETPLIGAPVAGALTLDALTPQWAVWSTEGSGGAWALEAARLPMADGVASGASLTLLASGGATPQSPRLLGGVWAEQDMVLAAMVAGDGSSVVLRFDLTPSGATSRVVARAQQAGHVLASPSARDGEYFWSDVWDDPVTGLHSVVWESDDSGHVAAALADDQAFHPLIAGNTLVWVDVPQPRVPTGADAAALYGAVSSLSGQLMARNLKTGAQWWIASGAGVGLQTAGSLVLWHAADGAHTYDVATRSQPVVDAQLRDARFAGADGLALTWGQPGQSAVAVVAGQ